MIYPPAIQVPGPTMKTSGYLTVSGVVGHSAVGYESGLLAVLNDVTSPREQLASWHFSVLYDGTVWQHYDTNIRCWHAQGANSFSIGIEHEGGHDPVDEPLTPPQLAASIALVRWLGQQFGFPLKRQEGLWEHNEFANKPCPSGRIPWDLYVEEDMDTVTAQRLAALLAASLIVLSGGDVRDLSQQDKDRLKEVSDAAQVLY